MAPLFYFSKGAIVGTNCYNRDLYIFPIYWPIFAQLSYTIILVNCSAYIKRVVISILIFNISWPRLSVRGILRPKYFLACILLYISPLIQYIRYSLVRPLSTQCRKLGAIILQILHRLWPYIKLQNSQIQSKLSFLLVL